MKSILLTTLVVVVSTTLLRSADESDSAKFAWNRTGNIGVNLSQVALKNWIQGGVNTIAINGLFKYNFTKNWISSNWDNTFEVGYGLTKLDTAKFIKSDDRLIFISKYNLNITDNLKYAALLDFRSQMTEGTKQINDSTTVRTSNFLAPAFLELGLGATWVPTPAFELTIAPIANRLTIVADDSLNKYGAFGVDSGSSIRSDLGSSLKMKLKTDLMENVGLESRLDIFSPYKELKHNIVTWNTLITLKVNDYITASAGLDVFYDHKIDVISETPTLDSRAQIRNVIAIGFGYKL